MTAPTEGWIGPCGDTVTYCKACPYRILRGKRYICTGQGHYHIGCANGKTNEQPSPPKPRLILHARQIPIHTEAEKLDTIEEMKSKGWTYKGMREGLAYFYLIQG